MTTTRETGYAFYSHPKSGDVYACRYELDNQRIVEAAGPVPQRDYEAVEPGSQAEQDLIHNWLSNADDREADGVWLDSAIWPND